MIPNLIFVVVLLATIVIFTRKVRSISKNIKLGKELEIKGPVKNITIPQGQNMYRFNFALLTHVPEGNKPLAFTLKLKGSDDRVLDHTESIVPAVAEP